MTDVGMERHKRYPVFQDVQSIVKNGVFLIGLFIIVSFIREILISYLTLSKGIILDGLSGPLSGPRNLAAQAEYWMSGKNPLLDKNFYNHWIVYSHPYPPLFPIIIGAMAKVLSISPLNLIVLLSPLGVISLISSFFYSMNKLKGKEFAVISTAVLIGATRMFGAMRYLVPRVIDWVLFPLMIFFYFDDRMIPFSILSIILIYQHGMLPLPFLISFLIYSYYYSRKKVKYFYGIFIVSLPLAFVTYNSAFVFFTEPVPLEIMIKMVLSYDPLLLILGFAGIFYTKRSEIKVICIMWIIFTIPLMFHFIHRFLNYISIPLTILGGLFVYENKFYKEVIILFSIALGLGFQLNGIYRLFSMI